MFLLHLSHFEDVFAFPSAFTFHYVSITSKDLRGYRVRKEKNLHSTMFLLHHRIINENVDGHVDLHSTMFLLHLTLIFSLLLIVSVFTFHYVSITSKFVQPSYDQM